MAKQQTSSLKKLSSLKTESKQKPILSKPAPKKIVYKVTISSSWGLLKKTLKTVNFQRKFLGLSVMAYAILSVVLVISIHSFNNVKHLKSSYVHGLLTIGKNLSASVSTLGSLSGAVAKSNNSASSVIEFLLFLLFSLMFIRAIREANKSHKLKFSDGLYSSVFPFIQFLFVIMILALETIPIVIATFIFQTIFSNGIAASEFEKVIWSIVCVAIALVGVYLLISSIFSLFIVTLPNMRPFNSIKSSWKLVKDRRLLISRKIIAMLVGLFIGLGLFALILVWLVPVISAWVLLVLGLTSFVLIYTYLYSLYRELL
jgi:hypothetical protein